MYDFIAIDFETANRHMNSACSLGLAAVLQGEIVERGYWLIQPPTSYFSPENTAIHGLTFSDVRQAETFPGIWGKVASYFAEASYVIAHNVHFDLSVLRECADTYRLTIPDFRYLDSIRIASTVKNTRGHSLSACARYFQINPGCHHNALDDAVTCAQIVLSCLKATGSSGLEDYLKRYPQVQSQCFVNLHPFQTFCQDSHSRRRFPNVKVSELTAASQELDPSHPLYQKNVTFTGELRSLDRAEAMQMVVDVGGVVKTSVSKKTHYLVIGVPDPQFIGEDGLSSKERKARELNAGGAQIILLSEKEFLELLRPSAQNGED